MRGDLKKRRHAYHINIVTCQKGGGVCHVLPPPPYMVHYILNFEVCDGTVVTSPIILAGLEN